MSRLSRSSILAAVSLAALAAATTGASAGGFAVREQSATAQGYSFAGAASGSGGLSSMFWNPATITMAPGFQSEWHASVIIPDVQIDPLAPTPTLALGGSGDIGQDAIVPTSYKSYQFNDYLWLGFASSAPFGLVTDPRQNWAGQVYSRSSRIFSLNVNPVVGVKVNNWLSFGAGPMIEYFDVRLKNATSPGLAANSLILEGDDWGFGFTAGVNITPFAGTSIGIGYRSSINHELEGSLAAPAGVFGPVGIELPIKAKLNTPDQITVGLSQAITPAMNVHLGFEWQNWSRLKAPAIVGPTGRPVSDLPLNYEDGYFYSLGADYRFNDRLLLRAGVAYEQSPIDTETRSTRLPDNDRYWASLGATYLWNEKLSFDLAYTYIWAKETKIRILPGHQDYAGLPFIADADSSVNIISAAIRYRWDDPAKPIPAPIVRKY
jgi:long-chain fatty acid transport protein